MPTKPIGSKFIPKSAWKTGVAKIVFFATTLILLVIYHNWFTVSEITGGDWWYLSPEMLSNYSIVPSLWSSQESLLGGTNPNYPFLSYSHFIIGLFVNIFHIPWNIVSLVFYFLLFIFVSIFSICYLVKILFPKSSLIDLSLATLIYTTNTYILLVASGGQMGIALSYGIAPLVLALFIKCINTTSFRNTVLFSLVLSIQILFDIRITYLTLFATGIYVLLALFLKYVTVSRVLQKVFVIAIITIGIQAYWLIPFFAFNLFFIPGGVTSADAFNFFSFATFENAIGLLHPNWPENIFGKIQFMRPEFIMLPIAAFSVLIFKNLPESKKRFDIAIFFLVGVALLGTFFSKGTNDPFNGVNLWVFENISGMNLFRDPTKFYLLIALSYAVLIPQTLSKISNLKLTSRKLAGWFAFFQTILPLLFILFWSILLWPAISGNLSGTLEAGTIPHEYQELAAFLYKDPDFYRTLGVPTHTRFRYQSEVHPIINANTFFNINDEEELVATISGKKELLAKLSVKYIVVPFDSEQELFLTDRKYDQSKRIQVERGLDEIPWLTKVQEGTIAVYKLDSFNDRFVLANTGTIEWNLKKRNHYSLVINSPVPQSVTFSEQYHPGWAVTSSQKAIEVRPTAENLMQFEIPKGAQTVEVFFKPEQYLGYGYAISLVILMSSLFIVLRR